MERWPQYRSHIVLDGQGKPRIHLNVLTYFLFWTAFYVLRGSHSSATSAATRPVRTLSLAPTFGSVKKVGACNAEGRTVEDDWDTHKAEGPKSAACCQGSIVSIPGNRVLADMSGTVDS